MTHPRLTPKQIAEIEEWVSAFGNYVAPPPGCEQKMFGYLQRLLSHLRSMTLTEEERVELRRRLKAAAIIGEIHRETIIDVLDEYLTGRLTGAKP